MHLIVISSELRARGITRVYVCGLVTDICVKATAIDGVLEGFDTVLVLDASQPLFPEAMEEVRAELLRHGVRLMSSDDVIAEVNAWA
jgi:nicotinamidase/pyrazinamidase